MFPKKIVLGTTTIAKILFYKVLYLALLVSTIKITEAVKPLELFNNFSFQKYADEIDFIHIFRVILRKVCDKISQIKSYWQIILSIFLIWKDARG